jgi:hypothetical protein
MKVALAAVAVLLTACGASSAGQADQQVPQVDRATAAPLQQEGVRHVLYSHCGVVSTTLDGTLWLAEPPLRDDSNNPPAGWDENDTPGLFIQQTATEATFKADTGVEARFTKADVGASDPAVDCE